MRVHKMREEAVEERDEHLNTIRPMILTKQEWRVKEKVAAPALTASDDDMDLMDDDESPLIKDRSPPPTGMDINMVFTLSAEFKRVEGEVAQMCLVYYDNVSVVYLSTNPVQHQRTKHVEIDLHFVREHVVVEDVHVLHVPTTSQFADIFTKGLPSLVFSEFRFSLNICNG
jgi:hypothetical protein